MKTTLIALLLAGVSMSAMASDATSCSAAAGSYVTGVVTTAPKFAAATETLQGVKLSHTLLNIKNDANGKTYQVAMDNVYAADYVKNSTSMPKSLAALKVGTHLELCGELYTSGSPGIHWVHDNCGDKATSSEPNGWTKILNGTVAGANLEASTAYCYLWD
jgi:hypothetical protein